VKKWTTLLKEWIENEDYARCFLCTRRLRPLAWKSVINGMLFSWLPRQYEVSFVRTNEGSDEATVFAITVCRKCGDWANKNPLAGEMLANARMESIKKHGEN